MEVDGEASNAEDDESLSDVNNAKDVDTSIILEKKDHPTKAPKGIHFMHRIFSNEGRIQYFIQSTFLLYQQLFPLSRFI